MTTYDITSRASDLLADIQRHKLLGTPLTIDDVAEALEGIAEGPEDDDDTCETCESTSNQMDDVSSALAAFATRLTTVSDAIEAVRLVYVLIGYPGESKRLAKELVAKIRAAK